MQENLLGQGVELMLFGMATVIAFLTLLVLATSLMSLLIKRFFPSPSRGAGQPPDAGLSEDARLGIISAAIHRHRSKTEP
ncbi:MAG: OadG family transporter subunit [Halieaceae bacterium]|nr:OadG family transporter subunit [Halieaceae bacterium]